MRTLSLIFVLLAFVFISANFSSDSPHGSDFDVPCGECHSSKGWKLDKEIYSFNHNATTFPLIGQHQVINCRLCHLSLVFSEAKSDCFECHTDIHQQTVGPDCGRCHTPASWIINNITELHMLSRFPLLGPHKTADCSGCHKSSSLLNFEPLGIECVDCHLEDYNATTVPDHVQGQYSKNCTECHSIYSFTWSGTGINHDFFPLILGHEISDCQQCHTTGDYTTLSPECVSCHLTDYEATINPNHIASDIATTCIDCHTLNPGWKPADYTMHDAQFFPIYSGEHQGTWNSCADCHVNAGNYGIFTCIDCHDHNQPDMDDEHNDIGGYAYNSFACFECHPTGDAEGSFNHNTSIFPLTGAHITTSCNDCHINGYQGTPTECSDCHINAYNLTTNPNHTILGIVITCATCHTTNPEWKPATFPTHNQYYALEGAHAAIANDCFDCHQNDYNNTPSTCVGCHLEDFNQTTNPPHASAQFSTDCEICHSQNAWSPSTFDHDGQYFPIYSGEHQGEWNTCNECHINPGNYAVFSCIDCHEHNQIDMDDEHSGVAGYSYNSIACLDCHPTGTAGKMLAPKGFKRID